MTAEMKKDDPFWIQLDEVPQPGLLLDLDLPQEWQTGVLGPVYAPADRRPHLRLRATRKLDQLSVEGEVELRTRFQCSRCAEPQTRDFHFKVAAVFIPASESELSPDDDDLLLEPDVQVCDYEARSFSIEQPFVEAAVLNVPAYPLCNTECKGLCAGCGANLNTEKCSCKKSAGDPRWAPLAGLSAVLKKQKRQRSSGGKKNGTSKEKALTANDTNKKVRKR
jgi:uncharacterized protein